VAEFCLHFRDAFGMFAAIAFVLLALSFAFSVERRSFLAKLLAFFIKFSPNGLLEYDAFFCQHSLCIAEFGLLPLNQFLLLTEATGSQFQFGSEFAMLAANASNLGGELPGPKFKGRAISFKLLLVGNQIRTPLAEFCKSLLQCLRCN
jgi:hypothetical protein